MARRERYLVGLDVGTSKIAAIVGEVMDDGNLDIIGIGVADSKGIRRVVNNVDSAAEVKRAIDEAEADRRHRIDVYLALSGAIRRSTAAAWWPWPAGTARSRADVKRHRRRPRRGPARDREIFHVPQDFVVDDGRHCVPVGDGRPARGQRARRTGGSRPCRT
jgi:cell division protein FtsA